MLDKADFKVLLKKFKQFEKVREDIIATSRDLIKESKKVIYAIHRDDFRSAKKNLVSMEKIKSKLLLIVKLEDKFRCEAISKVAFQEYAEAYMYYSFILENKIPTHKTLGIPITEYITGMCDLTGELVRKAVFLASRFDLDGVEAIRNLVDEIYWKLLCFNFRENEIRKKQDQVKYGLRKLEDLVLQLNFAKQNSD